MSLEPSGSVDVLRNNPIIGDLANKLSMLPQNLVKCSLGFVKVDKLYGLNKQAWAKFSICI
jgi:hypothetical protein